MILSGLVQTATGIVMERFGLAKTLGDVSQQGLSDIFYGIKALKSREEFTWDEYKRQKRENIAMAKLNPLMTRDILNSIEAKYELKRESLMTPMSSYWRRNERTSIVRIRQKKQFKYMSTEDGAINQFRVVEHKLDFYFQLQDVFDLFLSTLLEKTNNVIIKNSAEIKETLEKIHDILSIKEAQHLVNKEMKDFVYASYCHILNLAAKVWEKLLDNRSSKVDGVVTLLRKQREGTVFRIGNTNHNGNIFLNHIRENFDLNMGISVITRVQVRYINAFHERLRNSCSSTQSESLKANQFDLEERHRLQQNVMTNLQCELSRNAEKLTEIMIGRFFPNHNE